MACPRKLYISKPVILDRLIVLLLLISKVFLRLETVEGVARNKSQLAGGELIGRQATITVD